jgi:plasmid stabilization system protein ParE
MTLEFSEAAVDDLKRLRRFIAEHNPEAAQRIARRLVSAIQKLTHTPQIGWYIPELPGEIREFVFGQYVVRYAVVPNQEESTGVNIYILRVWHGKEDR